MTLTCSTILSKVDSKVNPYMLKKTSIGYMHVGQSRFPLYQSLPEGRYHFKSLGDWVNMYRPHMSRRYVN